MIPQAKFFSSGSRAYRLFLSILAATSLAALCILVIMQWSINRGFLEYLTTLDQGRLEQLAERPEQQRML